MKKNLIGIILLYSLFIVVLLLGQCIPRTYIRKNVWKSYEIMKEEGMYAVGDGWTDAYFLNAAITRYDGNIFERAFSNAYMGKEGEYPLDGILYLFDEDLDKGDNSIILYPRYWVGSMFFIKFMLLLFDIRAIRVLLVLIILCLFIYSLKLIEEKCGLLVTIAFSTSFLVYDYIRIVECIAFFLMFLFVYWGSFVS